MDTVSVNPIRSLLKDLTFRAVPYLILLGSISPFFSIKATILEKDRLTITIKGINKGNGEVIVSIFKEEKSWLDQPFRVIRFNPDSDTKTITFTVEKGEYSISVFQNENSNGELDRSWIGIPKEPIGFGNNYRPFGPPKFKSASVKHDKPETFHSIDLYRA